MSGAVTKYSEDVVEADPAYIGRKRDNELSEAVRIEHYRQMQCNVLRRVAVRTIQRCLEDSASTEQERQAAVDCDINLLRLLRDQRQKRNGRKRKSLMGTPVVMDLSDSSRLDSDKTGRDQGANADESEASVPASRSMRGAAAENWKGYAAKEQDLSKVPNQVFLQRVLDDSNAPKNERDLANECELFGDHEQILNLKAMRHRRLSRLIHRAKASQQHEVSKQEARDLGDPQQKK